MSESLTAVIFNCSWKKERTFYLNENERVRLNFSLELDMTMDFGEEEKHNLTRPSWRVINNPSDKLIEEDISASTRTVWITLAFSKHYLKNLINNLPEKEKAIINTLFDKSKGELLYKEFPLDHNMNLITSNLISMNLHDSLHLSYSEAKISELACVAIDWILQNQVESTIPVKLRSRDKEAIKIAHEIIMKNLSDLPTIREICMMIGMNRNKLHYGFKHIYNQSISQFIKETRLNLAYNLLLESDKSLIEIATEVGFTHQSSFSTSFRNQYGFSPNQLRKNQ